jgi:hypothetical protein
LAVKIGVLSFRMPRVFGLRFTRSLFGGREGKENEIRETSGSKAI